MIMTLAAGSCFRISSSVARPSRASRGWGGRPRSRITRDGRSEATSLKAVGRSPARRTWKSSRNAQSIWVRICSSSSTIRIVGFPGASIIITSFGPTPHGSSGAEDWQELVRRPGGGLQGAREQHADRGPFPFLAVHLDPPAVGLGDALRLEEPDPRAAALR